MEQQVSQTLWLPPGACVLNPFPTMQFQPTSAVTSYHQITPQLVKQQQMLGHSVPGTNILASQQLLPQGHLLQTPQGLVRVHESLLLPTSGEPFYEIPCATGKSQLDPNIPMPLTTTILPPELTTVQRIGSLPAKIMKKKRISPSAKRRSRMRLVAFLEAKKKQQVEQGSTEDSRSLLSVPESESPAKAVVEGGFSPTSADSSESIPA